MYFNSKQFVEWAFIYFNLLSLNLVNKPGFILGDPGADSRGEGKSKRFLRAIFSTRLDFPSSSLSTRGWPGLNIQNIENGSNYIQTLLS